MTSKISHADMMKFSALQKTVFPNSSRISPKKIDSIANVVTLKPNITTDNNLKTEHDIPIVQCALRLNNLLSQSLSCL